MPMASFSNQVKTEICSGIRKPADRRAFLTGILLSARRCTASEIILQTECEAFAELFPKLIQSVSSGIRFDTEFRARVGRQAMWCFTIQGANQVAALTKPLFPAHTERPAILSALGGRGLAFAAAGCFVLCGSVTDPERRYHLEIALSDAEFAAVFADVLAAAQPEIRLKATVRKHDTVLYLKQNEQICDALTYFGAPNASMELAAQQVYKNVRSMTNRRTNCDLANIDKSVAAGEQQISDIELIREKVGLDSLPAVLQEIAAARLADPDASLRELGAKLNPPLSRSGVNHRLQRISEIAAKFRGNAN